MRSDCVKPLGIVELDVDSKIPLTASGPNWRNHDMKLPTPSFFFKGKC